MGFAPLAISAGLSLMQAGQKQSAGEIAAKESQIAASQIELGAVQREADRKERLARAISSQNAEAGARGIAAFEGSPLSVIESDIKRAETASERDLFQSELSALTTRSRGKIARESAKQSAFIGLVGDFGKLAGSMPAGGGSSKPNQQGGVKDIQIFDAQGRWIGSRPGNS